MVSFLVVKWFCSSIRTVKRLSVIVVGLSLVANLYAQKFTGERRIYYLDATYSMITPSKLWDPVRKDLAKAINAIEDETTEIYVIAFGGNHGIELKVWNDYATDEGKQNIINGFMSFSPKKNTMTYLDIPLQDFYSNRVEPKKVTYCFLMTDGKNETPDPNVFSKALKQWSGKYRNTNVYGFYVMLNKEARDPHIENIIDKQEHLWKVETADVNINLIRLTNEVVFNIRTDEFVKIPFESGKCNGITINASLPEESGLKVKNSEIKDDCLIVEVDVIGSQPSMPEVSNWPLSLSVSNAGKFDFLVTEEISVKCNNKHEYVLTSPTSRQKWGKVSHYDKFWFVSSKVKPVKHSLSFKFNEDAKTQNNSFAEFAFVDNKGHVIKPEEMIVEIDGVKLNDNLFRITPDNEELNMKLHFPSNVKKGKKQGYLRLTNHNLHRLNNEECIGQSADAFQWTVYNKKSMNPLAKTLMWIGILIVVLLLLWFVIFRPMLYPHFPKCRKVMLVLENGQIKAQQNIVFTGARAIILSNKKRKQGLLDRLFKGKVKYIVSSYFEQPLKLLPAKRNQIRAVGIGYISEPSVIPRNGIAQITNIQKQIELKLQ